MDSALRPRDIQARIRAGESPDEVARAAGVPVERIAAFADPVVAERDHVAGLAQVHPVRRRGETTSHRTLRNAVADALAARGVDADAVEWDAWKLEDRRWRVRATVDLDGVPHEADFTYDQSGRFSVAANDDARAFLGDVTSDAPAVVAVDDDLAIVRALRTPPAPVRPAGDPEDEPRAAGSAEPVADEAPPAPSDDADDLDDAYREGELTEVDGVYDLVATSTTEMDVLYDMLSSFDEDSVRIYAGLVHPKEGAPAQAAPPVADDDEPSGGPAAETGDATGPDVAGAESSAAPDPAEPQQLSLIDDDAPSEPPKRPRQRRRRASVPSWDEIVFGAPRPEE